MVEWEGEKEAGRGESKEVAGERKDVHLQDLLGHLLVLYICKSVCFQKDYV